VRRLTRVDLCTSRHDAAPRLTSSSGVVQIPRKGDRFNSVSSWWREDAIRQWRVYVCVGDSGVGPRPLSHLSPTSLSLSLSRSQTESGEPTDYDLELYCTVMYERELDRIEKSNSNFGESSTHFCRQGPACCALWLASCLLQSDTKVDAPTTPFRAGSTPHPSTRAHAALNCGGVFVH
jgi:hypothetical protein